jgi:hypothetical protein
MSKFRVIVYTEESMNQKKQPKRHGTLKPRFSNCWLNTPISEPCRDFFVFGYGNGGDRQNAGFTN